MTARMERVRAALGQLEYLGRVGNNATFSSAALAEAEEWEAKCAAIPSLLDYRATHDSLRERAKVAEAERDRLAAALNSNNVWIHSMIDVYAINPQYVNGARNRIVANLEALETPDA